MAPRHFVLRADEGEFATPPHFSEHSEGYRRRVAVDAGAGSVHMGFGIVELDAQGSVDWHTRSVEESLYVLEGEVVCDTEDGSFLLRPGDYGIISVGASHAFRNVSSSRPARWADMLAPQPRADASEDTFFAGPPPWMSDHGTSERVREASTIDPRDPRTRSFGHIDAENMDPANQTQDKLAQSASMRTALLVYSGISVKMMIDSDLGANLLTMFMVQYEPGGFAGAHDHPLEEAYLILEGETDAVFDGNPYRLRPGDIAFAGVGCTHEFANALDVPVRWLETQAPQPPGRHSYRFARDWAYLQDRLSSGEQ